MNINNLQHITDTVTDGSPSPTLGIDLAIKSTSMASYQATSVQPQTPHLPTNSVATSAAMMDSSRQFANSLRLLSTDNDATMVTAGPSINESPRFLMPTTASASVKEEPDGDAMSQFNLAAGTSEAQSTPDMSVPVDKVYPLVISDYYTNPVLFSQDMKEKVTAQCRRCGRPVTGWWAPRLVTSNFITHLKSCSMQLYNHFLETKKRCGWAARRYTVKLHANSTSPGPAWNFSPGQALTSVAALPEPPSPLGKSEERAPVVAEKATTAQGVQTLRALLTFAAQEVRPPGSLCSGSVRRLLSAANDALEFPSETEIRQFLSRHQPTIEALALSSLPPLDRSVVLLSLHGRLHSDPFSSPACCLVAFWSCFIAAGSLHKRLFSVRRFADQDSALLHCLPSLDRRLGADSLLVLSLDPASYLRLPLTAHRLPADHSTDLPSLSRRLDLRTRLLPDFCRRLWSIFAEALRQVDRLPLLLAAALRGAGRPKAAQAATVAHLRQLAAALEAGGPYREQLPVLEAALNAGQYFEAAIQRLHRPGVSAGARLPLLLGLQKKCGAEGGASELVRGLRTALVGGLDAAIREEVADAASGEPSFSLLATFADPQYKLFWVEDAEMEARYRERIVKHLTARQPKIDESHDAAAAPSSTSTSSSPSSSADFVQEGGDGLLDFVTKRRRLAISSAGCDWPIMDEVQTYLGNHEEAGPLDFWANVRHQENYPNVYKLHLEVHAVPASCLDASVALGLSGELLERVAYDREWMGEAEDVAQSLVLAKSIGYDFSG